MKGRTIIFVRHGESDANAHQHADRNDPDLQQKMDALGDPGLTEMGVKQADATAVHLEKHVCGSFAVFTSCMRRAVDTASPFVILHDEKRTENTQLFRTALLNEYTRPGKKLTGAHRNSGIGHHNSWDDFTAQVPVFVDLMERLIRADTVVVFGHSLFLSVLVSYLASGKKVLPEKDQCVFRFPNASITTFVYEEDTKRWRVLHTASTAHLDDSIKTGLECAH